MNFGAFIRRQREAKNIGLRKMAKMIGVSPTYLSMVERGEVAPPVEDKVKAIADIIACDTDDLLARANRVSSDVIDIIKRRPVELAELVRIIGDLPPEWISSITAWAQRIDGRRLPALQPEQEGLVDSPSGPTHKDEDQTGSVLASPND